MATARNTFAHIQLNTADTARARKFYGSLFAWKLSDMNFGPGMTYTMIDVGSRETDGGIMPKEAPESPALWMNYVHVPDVKKAIARAKKLGASIVVPYQPIPGMGAFGTFIDPGGALLGVWEPEKTRRPTKKPAAKKARK